MSRRRIAWGVVANVYDRLIIAGSQLLLVPLLAHGWGVGLYGCWVLLATVPSFLGVADLGVGSASYVRMTTWIARGRREAAVVTLHTACRLQARASSLVLALGLAAVLLVPASWLPSDPALPAAAARAVLAMFVGYALLVLVTGLQLWTLRSAELFAPGAMAAAHIVLIEAAGVALSAATGHGPMAAAAAMLGGRAIGVALLHRLLARRVPWLRLGWARADLAEERALIRPALGSLLVPLGQALVLQGSVAALGAAAGPAAIPAFTAARTLSRVGLQGTQLLTMPIMPEFTAAAARNEPVRQARMLLALLATAAAGAVPLAALLWMAGPAVVRWWTGGAIVAAPALMRVVARSVVLAGAWTPLSNLMLAINRQASFSVAYVLFGAGALLLTGVLARSIGAVGAAVGMLALDAAMIVVVGRFAWLRWRRLPFSAAVRSAGRSP